VAGRFFAVFGSLATGGAPVGELVGLCDRLRRLEAGAIEPWCRAWLATAMARAGDSRAAEVARAAERDAALAEVPGAQVWAIMVQAELAPATRPGSWRRGPRPCGSAGAWTCRSSRPG
jgi:hypothetical protein